MNMKRIGILVIIIPLCANADIGPRGDYAISDPEVIMATNDPYYEGAEIRTADETHIATTAYVKGAYNDVIAGLNRVSKETEYKQTQLVNAETGDDIQIDACGTAEFSGRIAEKNITNFESTRLVTAQAVGDAILNRRIDIYTTWDDDAATTQVELSNVRSQNNN